MLKSRTIKLAFLTLLATSSHSLAQYEMRKYSINSGGNKLSGGDYEMISSIGQTDSGKILTGGDFMLNGGLWHENNDLIFKNGVE